MAPISSPLWLWLLSSLALTIAITDLDAAASFAGRRGSALQTTGSFTLTSGSNRCDEQPRAVRAERVGVRRAGNDELEDEDLGETEMGAATAEETENGILRKMEQNFVGPRLRRRMKRRQQRRQTLRQNRRRRKQRRQRKKSRRPCRRRRMGGRCSTRRRDHTRGTRRRRQPGIYIQFTNTEQGVLGTHTCDFFKSKYEEVYDIYKTRYTLAKMTDYLTRPRPKTGWSATTVYKDDLGSPDPDAACALKRGFAAVKKDKTKNLPNGDRVANLIGFLKMACTQNATAANSYWISRKDLLRCFEVSGANSVMIACFKKQQKSACTRLSTTLKEVTNCSPEGFGQQ